MKVKGIATAVMSAALALCCFLAAGCFPHKWGVVGGARGEATIPPLVS